MGNFLTAELAEMGTVNPLSDIYINVLKCISCDLSSLYFYYFSY